MRRMIWILLGGGLFVLGSVVGLTVAHRVSAESEETDAKGVPAVPTGRALGLAPLKLTWYRENGALPSPRWTRHLIGIPDQAPAREIQFVEIEVVAGAPYIESKPMRVENLTAYLNQRLAEHTLDTVFVRPDRISSMADVMHVVEQSRKSRVPIVFLNCPTPEGK